MAGRVSTYDLTQVICTFGVIALNGFGEGDAITIEFDDDQETAVAGADGDVVRVRNASRLATATVRLGRGSPAAAALRIFKASTLPPFDQLPFIVKDLAGGLQHQALQAWIPGDGPPPSFSADAPTEEWTFKLAKFETALLVPVTG